MNIDESPLLEVDRVTVRFGGIAALSEVSFRVAPDQIFGVIGPNGAGKTTLFNCLSRLYTPTSGAIRMGGEALLQRPAHSIASMGIGRTFQNVALFKSMTVLDNIMVGGFSGTRAGFLAGFLRTRGSRAEEAGLQARSEALIEMLDLAPFAGRPAGDLPFGVQKRVELARALSSRPKLLLLDEPAAGLNHEELEALKATLLRLRSEMRMAVLLVEHHVGMVMSLCDRIVTLNFGKKIAEGSPQETQADPAVIAAYLGAVP